MENKEIRKETCEEAADSKKVFEEPEMEIIIIGSSDIITASDEDPDEDPHDCRVDCSSDCPDFSEPMIGLCL